MLDFDDLMGCPFKIHGRNRNGFDCYGLVIEVEKRLGHDMTDYYGEYTNADCEKVVNDNCDEFVKKMNMTETDKPQLGDVIVFMNEKGCSVHVGVYLKKDDFIHCDNGGVAVENLKYYFRQNRKVYTWQK
jgi:cell wall-associated NlpC family hydrolase